MGDLSSGWHDVLRFLGEPVFSIGDTALSPARLSVIALVILLALWFSRLGERALRRLVQGRATQLSEGSAYALGRMVRYVLLVGGVLFSLSLAGVNFSTLRAPLLRASRSWEWMKSTAAKSRPKQGLATMRTLAVPGPTSRASTARWTLPPERLLMGALGPGVLTLNFSIHFLPFSRRARLLSNTPARESGARSKVRRAMFSATLICGAQALRSGSSGRT